MKFADILEHRALLIIVRHRQHMCQHRQIIKYNEDNYIFNIVFKYYIYSVVRGLSCSMQSSSLTRDRTWDPCIGARSLSHWSTRKVSNIVLNMNAILGLFKKLLRIILYKIY